MGLNTGDFHGPAKKSSIVSEHDRPVPNVAC